MVNISTQAELTKLLAANPVVLIDFWAEWCGPCKAQGVVIDQLAGKLADKAAVAKIDIDAAADLAREYRVRSIPTLLIFKNSEPVSRLVGLRSEAEILAELSKNY